jgi:hypothetical protein
VRPVLISLCGRWLQIPAAFSLLDDPVRSLLGREAVFEQVLFTFRHQERAVYATL